MLNIWSILIWITIVAMFFVIYSNYRNVTVNGITERRYGKLIAVIMVLPIIY